jgi:signal transduction histidine kinase
MDAIIDDVLALSRAGDAIDETEPVEISGVATLAWDAVPTAEAGLDIVTDATVSADGSRLQQLFENLFRNSVEHGGDDVTVTVGGLEDGFYVEDDGAGIPEAERGEVFESGYSTATDGTGFGLAIVADIAEAHGWAIRVTDAESGGARFEVTGVGPRDGAGDATESA